MGNVALKACLFYIFLMALFSCSRIEREKPGFYSMDSLLARQSKYLARNASGLTKVSNLDVHSDTVRVTPRSTEEWARELEIFAAIEDINKPANKDFYKIEMLPDSKSNLVVKAFTTNEALPVEFLRLYYQATEDRVRKIEAKYNESNVLYKSTRLLTMEFQQIDENIVLTSYEIQGNQKMFLSDSVKYSIRGDVTLSN